MLAQFLFDVLIERNSVVSTHHSQLGGSLLWSMLNLRLALRDFAFATGILVLIVDHEMNECYNLESGTFILLSVIAVFIFGLSVLVLLGPNFRIRWLMKPSW